VKRIKGVGFRSQIKINEFVAATVALSNTSFVEIIRRTMTAGQAIALGYGKTVGQANAEGRFYADLKDNQGTPAAIEGMLRCDLHDPNDRVICTLNEWDCKSLNTSETDRQQQMPLPMSPDTGTEDHAIVFKIKLTTSTATISQANSKFKCDVTKFDVAE